MLIGYMRPYQDDINCTNQLKELKKIPCDLYHSEEHASPKKRVTLQNMMNQLQSGDTVVVTRLFSIADSTRHLAELLDQINEQQAFLFSLHEKIDTRELAGQLFYGNVKSLLNFQSDIISENTRKGIYEAKEKGTRLGRPRKLDENVKKAIHMYESKKYSLAQIREETGISKTTLYRYLEN